MPMMPTGLPSPPLPTRRLPEAFESNLFLASSSSSSAAADTADAASAPTTQQQQQDVAAVCTCKTKSSSLTSKVMNLVKSFLFLSVFAIVYTKYLKTAFSKVSETSLGFIALICVLLILWL